MSDNDSKRYYWLKLKKDFFQQHQIKVLKSLPNGRLYALIYMELLAESTSHNGELRYSKTLPYDLNTLASVIDEDRDNLQSAIETLKNLELVEILEDHTIYMHEIQKLIGSETGQTIRKREARYISGNSEVKLTPENRVKSIEYRDNNNSIGESKTKRFIPPDVEEVKAYIKIKNLEYVNAEDFVNFYESKNWFVGKNKMTNWKSAISGWNSRKKPKEVNLISEDKKNPYSIY